ncbi:MAG: hypothetical protein KGR22_09965, partial [Planctomycetes bacterium]|nr:hypothetical protein [Planctomycetota bacterium]
CAALSQNPSEGIEIDAARRLSAAWSRSAVAMIADPATPGAACFVGALEVALAAAELAPSEAQAWRTVVDLAELGDSDDPAVTAASRRALKELSRLDPADDSVRLARVIDAIERSPTADERLKAYERLLTPESRKTLGAPVSARVAFDLALLEKRRGSSAGWLRWLRESTAIDPSFPLAAETLAGVEAGSGAPLKDVAAALVRSIKADPGSIVSLSALSRICLHEGLYPEAERLLMLAARAADLNIELMLVDDLIADRMLALWGMGRHDDAIKAFEARRRQVNAALRRRLGDSTASESESERSAGPQVNLPSAENSVWVAMTASPIMSPSGAIDVAKEAERKRLDEAVEYTLKGLEREREEATTEGAKAVVDLQRAWIGATLGDPATVEDLLASAQKVAPMSDEAVARFRGWVRLRRNDLEAAVALLQPIAEKDDAARVGLAMAYAGLGRQRDAAQELLVVAKRNRDNVVGLFAADRLHALVGKRIAPTDEATGIREALKDLPDSIYGLVTQQAQALSTSLSFGPPTNAFESMPLQIAIENRTSLPLEITPSGPIESKIALRLEATIIGDRKPTSLSPCIVPIDRRMLLKPRERLALEIDMSRTQLGSALLRSPLAGIIIDARVVTNFRLTADNTPAGFLGNISEKAMLRLPATVVTPGWREDAIGELRNPDLPGDVVKLVQLAHDLARSSAALSGNDGAAAGAPDAAAIEAGWAAVNASWKKLPPLAQAWTLMVLPNGDSQLGTLGPILEEAKVSRSEPVRLSYLLRWVKSPDDTQFEAASRAGGRLAVVASGVKAMRRAITIDEADAAQGADEVGVLGGGSDSPSDGR